MYFGKRRSSSGSENSFDYDGYKYSGEHDDADKKPDEAKHAHRKVHVIIGTAAIALAALSTSVYKVSEQQQAVLTRFGKVADVRSAGLYFRLPFGIDCVHMVPTITVGVPIGYTIDPETREEGTAGVASSTDDSTMITSDFNLLDVDFYLEYRVSDPVKYLYASNDPEGVLTNLAKASIRSVVSDHTVDGVMTTEKAAVQSEIKDALSDALADTDIGITIVNISMQDAEPPTQEIMSAFKAVESAKQDAETAVTNAKKYQSEQLPAAEAEADRIVQEAEAQKEARIAEADGQVARFNKTYSEYEKYPAVTKKRMFYEAMEDVLPDMKVIITDGNTQQVLPLDSFSGKTSASSAEKEDNG